MQMHFYATHYTNGGLNSQNAICPVHAQLHVSANVRARTLAHLIVSPTIECADVRLVSVAVFIDQIQRRL